jgi:hypothetical protein
MDRHDEDSTACRVPEGSLAPFSLFLYHHDPPNYALELLPAAREAVKEAFIQQGQTGSESDWLTVAGLITRAEAPDIFEKLRSVDFGGSGRFEFANNGFDYGVGEFDPSFVLTAAEEDLSDLIRLSVLLRNLYHDHARLAELIRSDPDAFEYDWF